MHHLVRVIVRERKAGARVLVLVVRLDRILETAGLANDRQRAVAQGHQLAESAGLEQRRHQERVGRCVDLVGQLIRVIDVRGDLVVVFPVKIPEHVLVSLFAGTQHNNLDRVEGEHLLQDIGDQIEALLIRQTGYDADHEALLILLEAKLLLQCYLVLDLVPAEVVDRVRLEDLLVVVRAEVRVIDSVQDPAQVMRTRVHKAVETFAVELGLDLLRVCGADRGDRVRIDKASLEKVGIPVGLQLVRREVVAGKTCDVLDILHIPSALEFKVVNGHDGLDPVEELIRLESLLEIDGYQACLPVMAVDQVGAEIYSGERGETSLGEESKPGDLKDRVVRVYLVCSEEPLIINKVESDPVLFCLEHTDIFALPMKVHVEVRYILHLVLHVLLHAGILGNHDSDVIVLRIDILGERTDNISQPAGLNERNAFGCDK